MNPSQPLVSVYITTCNRAEMLERAIESVIQCDYRPLEIIVVDDASSDHTFEVLEAWQQKLEGQSELDFVAIRQPRNQGACVARNAAIEVAKGKFITGLDDDDEFLDDRVGRFVEAWDERYAALCSAKEVDRGEGVIEYLNKDIGEISLSALLDKNRVGSQVFTLTERLQNIGGFDPDFPAWQDYETWIRLALSYGTIRKLPEVTYRVHTAHDKPRITGHEKSLQAIRLLRDKHGHRLSAHHVRMLKYRELTAAKTGYEDLGPWLSAMTWRTFPQILKRWFKTKLGLDSGARI